MALVCINNVHVKHKKFIEKLNIYQKHFLSGVTSTRRRRDRDRGLANSNSRGNFLFVPREVRTKLVSIVQFLDKLGQDPQASVINSRLCVVYPNGPKKFS